MDKSALEKAMEAVVAKQAVADVVQRWGRARDQGHWTDLAATFHPGGRIKVMWFEGPHDDFIAECAKRFTPGLGATKHFFGVSVVEVRGERALSETPALLSMAGELHGVRFTGLTAIRFLDRCEQRGGEWRIARRTCIYEADRFSPEKPVELDARILEMYAPPFRYLSYRQHLQGLRIDPRTPVDGSPQLEELMRDARAWLG